MVQGSSSDHYSFKRCRSANTAAKELVLSSLKVYEDAKAWPVMLRFMELYQGNSLP
eukprot:gene4051-2258_t